MGAFRRPEIAFSITPCPVPAAGPPPGRPAARQRGIGALKGGFEVFHQCFERAGDRRPPPDQHIVPAPPCARRQYALGDGPQPSARPVARHRVADLPAYRETDPDPVGHRIRFGVRTNLEDKSRCHRFDAGPRRAQEIAPLLQRWEHGHALKPRDACDPLRGDSTKSCGRPRLRAGHGTRGAACGPGRSAEKCVSRRETPGSDRVRNEARCIGSRPVRVNASSGPGYDARSTPGG